MISGGSSAPRPLPPSTPGTTGKPPGAAGTAGTAVPPAPVPVVIAAPVPVGTPAAPAAARQVVLTIASQGELSLDARPISDDALPRTLRDVASRSKDTQLVIRADKNATAGRVVHVMDQAQQAGLTRIALTVSP